MNSKLINNKFIRTNNILAIDTSSDFCSVALLLKNNTIISHSLFSPLQHTKHILSLIADVMNKGNINLQELSTITFCNGPGNFTGLRLSISIVQGLAYTVNIPVIPISNLQILAQEAFSDFFANKVLIIQNARMGKVYLGKYKINNDMIMEPSIPDYLCSLEQLKELNQKFNTECIGIGDGFFIYKEHINIHSNFKVMNNKIKLKYLLKLATYYFMQNKVKSIFEIYPEYLRENIIITDNRSQYIN